jgi:hypothetical protein
MFAVRVLQQIFFKAEVPIQVTHTHERARVRIHLLITSVKWTVSFTPHLL